MALTDCVKAQNKIKSNKQKKALGASTRTQQNYAKKSMAKQVKSN